jgi:uncharacterized protein YjeT (DUF2065 family)
MTRTIANPLAEIRISGIALNMAGVLTVYIAMQRSR